MQEEEEEEEEEEEDGPALDSLSRPEAWQKRKKRVAALCASLPLMWSSSRPCALPRSARCTRWQMVGPSRSMWTA